MSEFLYDYGYGLCALIGIVVSVSFVMLFRIDKSEYSLRRFIFIISCLAAGVIIGGKVMFGISVIPEYFKKGEYIEPFRLMINGGIVYYGGLLGGILAGYIAAKSEGIKFEKLGNSIACAIPLFHSFGRLGCLFAGCCYGKRASWGVVISSVDFYKRVPIQFIEIIFNLILFIVLSFLWDKRDKIYLLPLYLLCYAPFRFVNEFFRGDANRGFFGPLSTSQWVSIFIIVFTLIRLMYLKYNPQDLYPEKEKEDEKNTSE